MERDWQKDWELCEKATSGRWRVKVGEMDSLCSIPVGRSGRLDAEVYVCLGTSAVADAVDDAEFIAAAHQALPYWLQRVRELEAEVKRLEALDRIALKSDRRAVFAIVRENFWKHRFDQFRKENDELQARVRELEEENHRLRKVLEAAGITYNDALIIGRHLNEMERGSG